MIYPGPWGVVDRHFEPRYVVQFENSVDESDGYWGICEPDYSEHCHLIAAAPDLLESLKYAVMLLEENDLHSFTMHMHEVIRKAEQ